MGRSILYFIKLTGLVLIGFWLAERPGAIELTWQGYRIESTVGVLLLAIYILVLLFGFGYYVWRQLRRVPGLAGESILGSRKRRGYKALTQGMVAVAAGDAEEARRMAKRAEVLLDEPPLTMLLQAQAAQLGGDEAAARRYFEAMLERDETRFMGLRGLLMQALRDGDQDAALTYLEEARQLRPDAQWVAKGLLDLQLARGDYPAAQIGVARARRVKAITAAEGDRHRAVLLVAEAQDDRAKAQRDFALKEVREARKLAPDLLPAILLEADLLLDLGKDRAAARMIEKVWPETPHPRLAELYLRASGEGRTVEGLKVMERLAATAPESRDSLLALGRAALDARLWGEARRHLSAAKEAGEGEAVCRLMAELSEAEHNDIAAARSWLDKATRAPAEAGWICSNCGAQSADWTPSCGACGTFDAIAWQRPPRVAAAAGAAIAAPVPAEMPKGSPVGGQEILPAEPAGVAPNGERAGEDRLIKAS